MEMKILARLVLAGIINSISDEDEVMCVCVWGDSSVFWGGGSRRRSRSNRHTITTSSKQATSLKDIPQSHFRQTQQEKLLPC